MTATLADPGVQWITRERVPVYDAHEVEFTDSKTGKVVKRMPVTEELLGKIANARNAKIARTGNLAPILVGHTRYDLPEHQKAKWSPHVGWADRFEVGPHPEDGRPTMYARHRYYPTAEVGGEELTAAEIERRFPHRSVEVVLGRQSLEAVCLLAAGNTPARELGLLRMAAAADPAVTTADPPPEAPPMDPSAIAAALIDLAEKIMGGGGAAPPQAAAEPASPAAQPPAQYAAAMGARNGALPGQPDAEPELEKVRMQRNQEAIRDKRVQDELAALRAQLADQKLQYQRERREKDLIQLEAEGYDFDRAEELAELTPLPDDQYAARLAKMKARYQRVPIGFVRTAAVPEGGHGGSPHADYPMRQQIQDAIRANPGMTYDAAKAAVLGAKG